jgi:serine/threonine-protein phosphatase PGAM5
VIRYFVMRALQLPAEAWLRLAVSNASITVLYLYPSGRVSLYNLGEVGHLPPELITYN